MASRATRGLIAAKTLVHAAALSPLAWLGWQAFSVKVPLAAKLFLMFFAAFSVRRFMVPAIEGRA